MSSVSSPKSALATLVLCLFLGNLGIHRFYVGKTFTGCLMFITFGGLGIWTLIDLIFIATEQFEDKEGRRLEFKKFKNTAVRTSASVLVYIFSDIVLLISFIFSLIFYFTNPITSVVDDQLLALRSNDIEKAYSYTAQEFRKEASIEEFKNFIGNTPALKNNKNASFTERQIKDDLGRLEGTVISQDGVKTRIEYSNSQFDLCCSVYRDHHTGRKLSF